MKILITGGSHNTLNKGVQALSLSTIKGIRKFIPDCKFVLQEWTDESYITIDNEQIETALIYYHEDPNEGGIEKFKIYNHTVKEDEKKLISYRTWKRINECDAIIHLNGGDSFSDTYDINDVKIFMDIGKIFNIPVFFLPQTYGDFTKHDSMVYAMNVLNNATHIATRDKDGMNFLKHLLKIDEKIHSSPDIAFILNQKKKEIEGVKENSIGINVSCTCSNDEEYIKNIIAICSEHIKDNIILIPHADGDLAECIKIQEQIQNDVFILDENVSAEEMKYIIKRYIKRVYTARMHLGIFALSLNKETYVWSYSKKIKQVFGNIGYEEISNKKTHQKITLTKEIKEIEGNIYKYFEILTKDLTKCQ